MAAREVVDGVTFLARALFVMLAATYPACVGRSAAICKLWSAKTPATPRSARAGTTTSPAPDREYAEVSVLASLPAARSEATFLVKHQPLRSIPA